MRLRHVEAMNAALQSGKYNSQCCRGFTSFWVAQIALMQLRSSLWIDADQTGADTQRNTNVCGISFTCYSCDIGSLFILMLDIMSMV